MAFPIRPIRRTGDYAASRSSGRAWASGHETMLSLYRDLIALRRAHPALSNGRKIFCGLIERSARWLVVERRDEGADAVAILV